MPDELVKIGRLAMRDEGGSWVAYYALPDSMDEPVLLGSIRMGAVVSNRQRRLAFMQMMRDIVSDIIEEKTGTRPLWPDGPQRAPENERGGHS